MTWERHIFAPGRKYRVTQSFSAAGYAFASGEVVQFVRDYYSFYDNSFVYEFVDANGVCRYWWMHESKPLDSWHEYFEPAD